MEVKVFYGFLQKKSFVKSLEYTNFSFGHYARVLVDINLAGFLPDSLMVEREEFAFDIEIEYEKMSYFCFTCNSIGHSSDHCKNDPANKIAHKMVASKNDHAKKIKQDWIPKSHVDHVQGCNKYVADEDTIVFDIIRSKDVVASVQVEEAINLEEELSTSIYVGVLPVQSVHVEVVHPIEKIDKQIEDHQSKAYPDMRIVGSWCDAVRNQDYLQDPQSWCGGSSVNEVVLNPKLMT